MTFFIVLNFLAYSYHKSKEYSCIWIPLTKRCSISGSLKRNLNCVKINLKRLYIPLGGTKLTKGNVELSEEQREELLNKLKDRFEKNMNRHSGIEWINVQSKLQANVEKLWSLNEMEKTQGEPDVVGYDEEKGEYIFNDCSAESPKGRRSVCYDQEALESRKKHKPENSAMEMAAVMGIELLTEEQYRKLMRIGSFDMKTSSWVQTPDNIRKLGGALFCDYRYDTVFVYHNGADSYYGARGFRGTLRV